MKFTRLQMGFMAHKLLDWHARILKACRDPIIDNK
jgi:hypothetical protein